MCMAHAIEEIYCNTAETFLQQLDLRNKLWENARHFWAFRGHSNDEEYELVPSAYRIVPEAQLGYSFSPKKGVQSTNKTQIDAEFERIHEFYWAIDTQGLSVPGDNNLMRTPLGWKQLENKIESEGWPIDELLPLLSLAQHYGVHTRLLDWSDKPLVAAFFAAKSAAKAPKGKNLCIWAVNLDWIINKGFPGTNPKMAVYIVTAPRGTNPNLHAQGGVFTTENLTRKEFERKVKVRPVEKIVQDKWKSMRGRSSVMAHITLPVVEAPKLLRLLNQEHINSATLFPGYKGVAESITERSFWDKPERATYWI